MSDLNRCRKCGGTAIGMRHQSGKDDSVSWEVSCELCDNSVKAETHPLVCSTWNQENPKPNEIMSDKLKPCPFCGDEMTIVELPSMHPMAQHEYVVRHRGPETGCIAALTSNRSDLSEAGIIAAWNTRHEPKAVPLTVGEMREYVYSWCRSITSSTDTGNIVITHHNDSDVFFAYINGGRICHSDSDWGVTIFYCVIRALERGEIGGQR